MNTEHQLHEIKAISIAAYLSACGIEPIKRYGGYALYNAPYREDHNASLKVDFVRNLWYDFGLCKGGSIIDLVMLMKGYGIREAIAELTGETTFPFHSPAMQQPTKVEQQSTQPEKARRILSISEELPPHLRQYLQGERGIDLELAKPYLRAITYAVGERTYTGIGFPNRAGGYELRDDKSFKGTIAPKDISLIGGTNSSTNKSPTYSLFEGFIDFLSYLTMKEEATTASIVLNSVGNIHKAIAYLREHHIREVRAFLDNDEAGRQALQSLSLAGIQVQDMSQHYAGCKDLNEFLLARQKQEKDKKVINTISLAHPKRGLRR